MDTDSMMSKFSYENKLRDFAYGKYDIMLGTQMVAKGLDFPNVTLVGVLSADQSLYSGDFKSYERTFSLLTQVVGRAGRNQHNGFAVIQTFTPENPIINLAAKQDYDSFYADEIILRKALLYPPFAKYHFKKLLVEPAWFNRIFVVSCDFLGFCMASFIKLEKQLVSEVI